MDEIYTWLFNIYKENRDEQYGPVIEALVERRLREIGKYESPIPVTEER